MTAPDSPGRWSYTCDHAGERSVLVGAEQLPDDRTRYPEPTRLVVLLPGHVYSVLVSALSPGTWTRLGELEPEDRLALFAVGGRRAA